MPHYDDQGGPETNIIHPGDDRAIDEKIKNLRVKVAEAFLSEAQEYLTKTNANPGRDAWLELLIHVPQEVLNTHLSIRGKASNAVSAFGHGGITVTVYVPEGYKDIADFLSDCGLEPAPGSSHDP